MGPASFYITIVLTPINPFLGCSAITRGTHQRDDVKLFFGSMLDIPKSYKMETEDLELRFGDLITFDMSLPIQSKTVQCLNATSKASLAILPSQCLDAQGADLYSVTCFNAIYLASWLPLTNHYGIVGALSPAFFFVIENRSPSYVNPLLDLQLVAF